MIYFCKSKLSLADVVFFEENKLYEGNFEKETNCYWLVVKGGDTPIEIGIFKKHFEDLNTIRDRKLKQILK